MKELTTVEVRIVIGALKTQLIELQNEKSEMLRVCESFKADLVQSAIDQVKAVLAKLEA